MKICNTSVTDERARGSRIVSVEWGLSHPVMLKILSLMKMSKGVDDSHRLSIYDNSYLNSQMQHEVSGDQTSLSDKLCGTNLLLVGWMVLNRSFH